MSTINDGGPAFPALEAGCTRSDAYGMTLRDYFAAKAMQEFIAGTPAGIGLNWDVDAKAAYEVADAMLKAREAA